MQPSLARAVSLAAQHHRHAAHMRFQCRSQSSPRPTTLSHLRCLEPPQAEPLASQPPRTLLLPTVFQQRHVFLASPPVAEAFWDRVTTPALRGRRPPTVLLTSTRSFPLRWYRCAYHSLLT